MITDMTQTALEAVVDPKPTLATAFCCSEKKMGARQNRLWVNHTPDSSRHGRFGNYFDQTATVVAMVVAIF
jgi:hypothetical protein